MISVIIPAHDEEAVIARCLETLRRGFAPGELEVVVVCNGCSDATRAIAETFSGVRVLDSDVASKSHALNLGDRSASGFPRFYLDADIRLEADSVRRVAAALDSGPLLAASPAMVVDLSACGWAVRAFYRIWLALPYVRSGTIGAGVYALSEAGRARFKEFPPITADDGFVRLQFTEAERGAVAGARFVVTPPRTLSGVIKIKTRSHFGNLELRQHFPGARANEQRGHEAGLLALLARPTLWPALLVYLYVRVRVRLASHWKLRFGDRNSWERDDSSRVGIGS